MINVPALVSSVGGAVVVGALLLGIILGAAIHRTVSDQSNSVKDASQKQAAEIVETLDDMAGARSLSSDPDELKRAVETLRDTVDRIAKEGGINGRDSRRRAEEIERALDADRIAVVSNQGVDSSDTHRTGDAIGSSSRSSHEGEHNKSVDHVRGAAQQVGRPESRTARRLVMYLEDPSRSEETEIQEALQATVTALDEYAAIDDALTSLPPNPREAGDQLSARVRRADTEPADALGHVGEMLSETA